MISVAAAQLKPHLCPLCRMHTNTHAHHYCYYTDFLPLTLITSLIGLMNGALWTVMCVNRPLELLGSLHLT